MKIHTSRLYDVLGRVELSHITLYGWFLAAKIWVTNTHNTPLPENTSPAVRVGWVVLGFLCPAMIFGAYWLIWRRPGKARYVGLWMRLGGDTAQMMAMLIFLAGLLNEAFGPDTDGHHGFTAFLVGAVMTFLASMVVRDVLAIVRTERLAADPPQ